MLAPGSRLQPGEILNTRCRGLSVWQDTLQCLQCPEGGGLALNRGAASPQTCLEGAGAWVTSPLCKLPPPLPSRSVLSCPSRQLISLQISTERESLLLAYGIRPPADPAAPATSLLQRSTAPDHRGPSLSTVPSQDFRLLLQCFPSRSLFAGWFGGTLRAPSFRSLPEFLLEILRTVS